MSTSSSSEYKNREVIVSVSLSTKHGIDVYSSKIIPFFNVYKRLLYGSGIDVVLNYEDPNAEEIDLNNYDSFDINDVLDNVTVDSSPEHVRCFRELYGEDFNSGNHKVFDIIENEYIEKYKSPVCMNDEYTLYERTYNKLYQAEKEFDDIYKTLHQSGKTKADELELKKKLVDGYSLLENINEHKDRIEGISKSVVLAIKNIKSEYKPPVVIVSLPSVPPPTTSTPATTTSTSTLLSDDQPQEKLIIKKNLFGQYVYEKYGLVLDPKEKCIIGRPNGMGGVHPLDIPLVELCKRLKLKYRV